MVRANRKLTGAVLLASYIAATLGAWSHGRHDCRTPADVTPGPATHVCHDHALAMDDCRPVPTAGIDSSHRGALQVVGSQHDAHVHHLDQCLICQFLAIQKVIELSGGAVASATVLAQRLVSPEHELLAAERIGMPESRGPPRAC